MKLPLFVRKFLKQKEMINFYKDFVNDGDLCFDIGANIGERTSCFLKLGANVIAVEPQKSCFDLLEKKYEKNNHVKVLKYAVGSVEKEDELMICDETDECSTLSQDFVLTFSIISKFHWNKKEKVKVTTLEKLFLEYGVPKFCKIDVEGYELEVFRGLNSRLEYIAFEFNRPLLNNTIECIVILSNLGTCQVNFIRYEFMELALKEWMPSNIFLEKINELIPEKTLTGEIVVRYIG